MFYEKSAFKSLTKFTEKHLSQSLFFLIKKPATLWKKKLWHSYFPVSFKNFYRTPLVAVSGPVQSKKKESIHRYVTSVVLGVILARIFRHSDWIRTRITPNTDTFYAVSCAFNLCHVFSGSNNNSRNTVQFFPHSRCFMP